MKTNRICKWCGEKSKPTGTHECGDCWELRTRIEANPAIASEILSYTNEKNNESLKIDASKSQRCTCARCTGGFDVEAYYKDGTT